MKCFGEKPKSYHCKVVLLDETELIQEIQNTSRGQHLLDVVYKHLNLLETAFFGLRFIDDSGQPHWLDATKKIHKQMKGVSTFTFYFGVKFYASDPCKLLEEITRYQFFLQVKQDIYHGRLPVSFDLAAELFACAVQSELGDYDPRRHHADYVSEFRFLTNQTSELEEKVMELHRGLKGQVPATAEINFLDKVKWLDMYGVDLHPVIGEDNTEYFLGLTPSGVVVLRNKGKVGNYYWPRITKVYYKGCYFMLQVRDKANDESTYGFELPTKQACKHLWKCCVDHHSFFRLAQSSSNPLASGKLFGLGGKFRLSGRRQRPNPVGLSVQPRPQPVFTRVPSKRYQRRLGQPDGADAGTQQKEVMHEKLLGDQRSGLGNQQPSPKSSAMYRSISVPMALPASSTSNGTAMPPWEDPKQRGLFSNSTNPSPKSVRSSGSRHSHAHCRSSSIDLNGDSRRRRHRSRRNSDNESEVSKSSRGSRGSRCSRGSSGCRHSCHSRDSGSESDAHHRHRHKHRHHRKHRSYELVDSEAQWKEVQRQQNESNIKRPQNAVVRDLTCRKSGYVQSGMETESEAHFANKKKHRRHRSRSKSPDTKKTIPADVKKHIEYSLIDPDALTEQERRDIKYTKVETDSRLFKIRYSPTAGRNAYRVAKVAAKKETKTGHDDEDGPPPPYSTTSQQQQANGTSAHEKSQIDPPGSTAHSYKGSHQQLTSSSAVNGSSPFMEGDHPTKLPVFTSRASSTSNLLAPTTTNASCMTPLANGGVSFKSTAIRPNALYSQQKDIRELLLNGSSIHSESPPLPPRSGYVAQHQPTPTRYHNGGFNYGCHANDSPSTPSGGHRVTFQTPPVTSYNRVYESSPCSWNQRPGCSVPDVAKAGTHEMSTEL
ncbi:band 4.1-like protein 4 [Ornithodoros turicata]|uniref:band 4.1-like protein 4 n=1 Tax=Ornithodoros turicata TaxID=34597 RepID=UPI003139EA2F